MWSINSPDLKNKPTLWLQRVNASTWWVNAEEVNACTWNVCKCIYMKTLLNLDNLGSVQVISSDGKQIQICLQHVE